MKKLISLLIISTLLLSSCGKKVEETTEKSYKTFLVKNGTLTMTDTVIASIE